MENGVENGLLPDGDQLEARENQMSSSTDGEGEGEGGDSTPQPPQTTNDDVSDGDVDGERDMSVSDAAEAEAEADTEVPPTENSAPCQISILEDSLCEKDVDSDAPDDENDDEVRGGNEQNSNVSETNKTLINCFLMLTGQGELRRIQWHWSHSHTANFNGCKCFAAGKISNDDRLSGAKICGRFIA